MTTKGDRVHECKKRQYTVTCNFHTVYPRIQHEDNMKISLYGLILWLAQGVRTRGGI